MSLIANSSTIAYYLERVNGGLVLLGAGGLGQVFRGYLEYMPDQASGEMETKPIAIKAVPNIHKRIQTEQAIHECRNLIYVNNLENKVGWNFYPSNEKHPNIVELYACITVSMHVPYHYFAMELMESNLYSYCRYIMHPHQGPSAPDKGDFFKLSKDGMLDCVKLIMKGILNAFLFLHANKVVHGDFKSGNVLITTHKSGPDMYKVDKVKLSDFDRCFDYEATKISEAGFCSWHTRAPEMFLREIAREIPRFRHAKGKELKPTDRFDIYGCGAELHSLLYLVAHRNNSQSMSYHTTMPIHDSLESVTLWFQKMVEKYGNPSTAGSQTDWPLAKTISEFVYKQSGQGFMSFVPADIIGYKVEDYEVRTFNNEIPREWCQAMMDMLKMNPDKRPSAAELLSLPLFDGDGRIPQMIRKHRTLDDTVPLQGIVVTLTQPELHVAPPQPQANVQFVPPPQLQRQRVVRNLEEEVKAQGGYTEEELEEFATGLQADETDFY